MISRRATRSLIKLLAGLVTAAVLVPAPGAWAFSAGSQAPPSTDPAPTDPPPTEPPPTTEPPTTEPPVETDPPTSSDPPESSSTTTTTDWTTTTSTVPGVTTTTSMPYGPTSTTSPDSSTSSTSTSSTTTTMPLLPVDVFGPLPAWNMAWRGGGWRSSGRAPGATWPVPGRTPGIPATPVGGSGIGTGIGGGTAPEGDEPDEAADAELADVPVDVDVVLSAIRAVGPGDDYGYVSADGRTGAYLYNAEQWGGYAGYDEARLAPPAVQDARARGDAQRILNDAEGDVAGFASQWFLASVETTEWWEQYSADHSFSVGVYQSQWTEVYIEATSPTVEAPDPQTPTGGGGESVGPVVVDGPTLTSTDPAAVTRADPRGAPPVPATQGSGAMRSIVFPVLGPVDYYPGWNDCRDECMRRHEGVDILGVRMQPLLAAVDGTVTSIGYRGSDTAGVGITITGSDGWRYGYYHVNNDNPGSDDGVTALVWQTPPGLGVGDRVRAGQVIAYMGDSGNSEHSVPHVHFEIRDPAGIPHDPFWSLQAAERRQACTIGLGPWSNPIPIGQPGNSVAYTTVTPLYGDGAWYIDSEGRVAATGDAALIEPSRGLGCQSGPTIPYGTDAGGWL